MIKIHYKEVSIWCLYTLKNSVFFFFVPILFLSTHISSFANNQNTFIIDNDLTKSKTGRFLSILKDENYTIEDIVSSDVLKFIPSANPVPNLGLSDNCYWLKLEIKNNSNKTHFLLEIANPILDEVDFYELNESGTYYKLSMGDKYGFSQRKYKHPNYIFDIFLENNRSKTFYIKIKSTEQIILPIFISSPLALAESITLDSIVSGIYIGIILIMFFYNMFLYFAVRDKSYLYYVTYILCMGLTQIAIKGYTIQYLWPESNWLATNSTTILGALGGLFTILFIQNFLQTKKHLSTFLNNSYHILSLLFITSILLSVFDYNVTGFKLMHLITGIVSFYSFGISFYIFKQGFRPARFFFVAWSILLTGAIIFVLKDYGIIPFNKFTNSSMQIASALEMALLSFALADRINILRKEKEISQAKALKAALENEQLIKQQNLILEQRVLERTSDLEQTNEELMMTLENLKNTQSQLVDAEKMASLGQLTAGIAHEINNPINFVTSNVNPLKRDIADINEYIRKVDDLNPNDQLLSEKINELKNTKKQLDIDFIFDEIDMLLNGIDEGAKRTSEIVKGLRNFSRLDEDDLKRANIIEGIQSTIVVLNNSIKKENVQLITNFEPLPEIECYPGKMNQLIMNIINNAIHATRNNDKLNKEKIVRIDTLSSSNYIIIKISDNGVGMNEETKLKIFNPFYTTKDVGEGTGLGLSIAYSIIESHKGKITVDSTIGEGTCFTISIPVKI